MDKYLLEDGLGFYEKEGETGDYLLEQQAGQFDGATVGITSMNLMGAGH